jgi:hypothetical protein
VLDRPDEHNATAKPPAHSEVYEKGMGLVFILGSAAALFVVFFVLSFFD